jgi:hypothetical protein
MLPGIPLGQQIELISTFARRVREGKYRVREGTDPVRCPTVQVALRAIGATFELAHKPNPTYRAEGRYHRALEHQLEGYRRADPPSQPKLAVPVAVVNHLLDATALSKSPKQHAIADMCLVAFYFLLRVGEYTKHGSKDNRRTKQFRACDVTFYDNDHNIIPNTSPLSTLLTAASVTMRLDNQKNGVRGAMIHHTALRSTYCPLRALARRVHHIMNHPNGRPTNIISTYFTYKTSTGVVPTSTPINSAVKTAVRALGLEKQGVHVQNVSSHSLRAGGAMAMHLNGIDRDKIRKMGRWSSDTWLMYIHEQISAFSIGIASKMAKQINWHNIEGPTIVAPPAAAA